MRYIKQSITAFLLMAFLVACTGSDGGSASPAPIPSGMAKIDTSSAAPITGEVVDAVFASGKFGDVLRGGGSISLIGHSENGQAKTGSAQAGGFLGYFKNVSLQESTTPCAVDGSVTVSGQVADSATLSAEDQVLLQFVDCDDGAGQVLNGVFEIEVNSFSGEISQGLIHLNATVTLGSFEVREGPSIASLDGDVTLDLDTTVSPMTSISASGDSLSVSDNTDAATLTQFQTDIVHDAGVAPNAYTSAASGTLTSTLFAGAVKYSTPVPLMGYAGGYPFAGELLVTGADGSSVTLFAVDNINVRLDTDPGDGSGIVSEITTWTQLTTTLITGGTGIRGQVLRGPIYPGPEIEGVSNEEPFSAWFSVLDSQNISVAQFESDENGMFEIVAPSGEYTVVPDAAAPILFPEQQTKAVVVPDDGFADVVLGFDTGIR